MKDYDAKIVQSCHVSKPLSEEVNHTKLRNRDKVSRAQIWQSQQQQVYNSLLKKPQTRLQVAQATRVPIQNVCRYVGTFKKSLLVFLVKIDRCPISGMKAEFLSTDPKYAPNSQLKIFQA